MTAIRTLPYFLMRTTQLTRLSQLDLFKKHNLLISLTSAYGSLHYKKKATLSGWRMI
jgi:hypothetical protein